MQNLFTSEYHAAILMDTYRAEARRHDLLAQARAGRPRRMPGGALLARVRTTFHRFNARSPLTPACQPGMAC